MTPMRRREQNFKLDFYRLCATIRQPIYVNARITFMFVVTGIDSFIISICLFFLCGKSIAQSLAW